MVIFFVSKLHWMIWWNDIALAFKSQKHKPRTCNLSLDVACNQNDWNLFNLTCRPETLTQWVCGNCHPPQSHTHSKSAAWRRALGRKHFAANTFWGHCDAFLFCYMVPVCPAHLSGFLTVCFVTLSFLLLLLLSFSQNIAIYSRMAARFTQMVRPTNQIANQTLFKMSG